MSNKNEELIEIITKFSESGWDVIDSISQSWLNAENNSNELISAITQADTECGSCGCEFDPLYKRALVLLQGA